MSPLGGTPVARRPAHYRIIGTMALKYPPFACCSGMEQASRNAPALGLGSSGPAVALVQGALIDLGEKLPISTKKTGGPDGRFGVETKKALKGSFKRHFTWKKGGKIPQQQLYARGGR